MIDIHLQCTLSFFHCVCVCAHSHACERTQERWTSEAEKGEKRRKVEMSRYCSQGCKGGKRKNE